MSLQARAALRTLRLGAYARLQPYGTHTLHTNVSRAAEAQVNGVPQGSRGNRAIGQLHSDLVRHETNALDRTAPAPRFRSSGAVSKAVTVGFEPTEA